jgi:hypothetical protein
LGVTGSGKTFTAANVIQNIGKPTLVIAHNKTLAAQLAQEYREFFPENAVHYFVSYYDFYQPEAYMPVTDTYIEKEAMINEEIERLRHASTQALLTRKDVIIVASVSCIYGLGNPEEYEKVNMKSKGQEVLSEPTSSASSSTSTSLAPTRCEAGHVPRPWQCGRDHADRRENASTASRLRQQDGSNKRIDATSRTISSEVPRLLPLPGQALHHGR